MSNTLCNFAEMITSKVMEKRKKKEWKDFKFNLFGTTWRVHFVDFIPREPDEHPKYVCYGKTNDNLETITIARRSPDGEVFSDAKISFTIYHEIVHACLGTGCYGESNNDEPLVEFMGRCLSSLVKQNVFEYAAE